MGWLVHLQFPYVYFYYHVFSFSFLKELTNIKFAQEDASTLKSQDEDVDDSIISVMERVRRLNR